MICINRFDFVIVNILFNLILQIKAIVLVTLAAAANCALLPSHSLVAPRQHQFGFQPKPTFHVQPTYQHVAPPGSEAYAQVLRSESVVNPESFKYSYETSNGIQGQEAGHLKQVGPQAAIATQGRFHWTSPEGQPIDISYVADENGIINIHFLMITIFKIPMIILIS